MNVKQFLEEYSAHPLAYGLDDIVLSEKKGQKFSVKNLIGSGVSVYISHSFLKNTDNTFLIICDDAEKAGYLYSDLSNFVEDKEVFIFPESYKKGFKVTDLDNTNVLKRAEVISRLSAHPQGTIIVSYPAALCELVIAGQTVHQKCI